MYDLLSACVLIAVIAGLGLVRMIPLHKRLWIGLGLLAGAYCAASIGLALVRVGFDSRLLRYAWAGSFGAMAIPAVVFLVPSLQDWLRARWRRGHLKGSTAY
jgi:hypothetical protein